MSANIQRPSPSLMKVCPILAMARRAAELRAVGRNIVDLTLGEPDFAPPPYSDATVAAPRRPFRYTPAGGIPALDAAAGASIARNQEVLAKRNVIYRRRRDAGMAIVPESAQLRVQGPGSEFCFYAHLRNHSDDVAEAGVATVPGSAFGAPKHLRLSVAKDIATLDQGCRRRMVHAPGAR